MELTGIVVLLAWLALAAVCVRRKRGLWVLGAVMVPVAAFIVGLLMLRFVVPFEGDGGLGDYGLALGVAFLVTAISFLSSFLLLALGAILPSTKTTRTKTTKPVHYHTRWQDSTVANDPSAWNGGPDFYSLDAAHRWAQGTAKLQAVSVVEIYTKEPTGANVVEIYTKETTGANIVEIYTNETTGASVVETIGARGEQRSDTAHDSDDRTASVWHGIKECPVTGTELPDQILRGRAGEPCPFCGNPVGAFFSAGTSPPSPPDQAPAL